MAFTSSRHLSGIFLNGDIFYIKFMSADSNTLQSPGGLQDEEKVRGTALDAWCLVSQGFLRYFLACH